MRLTDFIKQRETVWLGAVLLICFICLGIFYKWQAAVAEKSLHRQWQQLTNSSLQALREGSFTTAKRLCNEATKMAVTLGPKDTCLSRSQLLLGSIYAGEKKFDLAEKSFKDAIASCEKAVRPDDPGMLIPLDNLADFYYFIQKKYDQVLPLCQQILKIVKNAPERNDREVADRTYKLANVYQKLGQYSQAEPLYKEALKLAEKNNYNLPDLLLKMANFYREWDKCNQADPLAKRALLIREKAASLDTGADAQKDFSMFLYLEAELNRLCGKLSQADSLYTRSKIIIEKIAGKESSELTQPMTGLAWTLYARGKNEAAEARYKLILAWAEKNMLADDPELDIIVEGYATLLDSLKKPEKEKALRQDHKWKVLMNTSARTLKLNMPDEAMQLGEQALKMAGTFGPKDTRFSSSQTWMGELYRSRGKYDLAEQFFKNAVATCEKAVGADNPSMVSPLESLANFYLYTRINYDRVADLYLRILKIVRGTTPLNNAELVIRIRNLADVYLLQGKYTTAEPLYKQALQLTEKAASSTPDDIVQYLQVLADFYRTWGKYNLAEPLAKRALAIREKEIGPDAPLSVVVCLDILAEIYLGWNKPEMAEPLYRRSLAIVGRLPNSDSSEVVPRLIGMAKTLRAQGKYEQTETQYKRALNIFEKCKDSDVLQEVEVLKTYATLLNDMKKPKEAKILLNRADSIFKHPATQ
jgi:Tetratricopeptide repeat.